MQIEDRDRLKGMFAPPADPAAEPIANFPLPWYEQFLQRIVDLDIRVVTYRDLFLESADWDYRSNYEREFESWRRRFRDSKTCYLLIQHDVDNHPFFTKRMVAMEQRYGIRSNIFIFRERFSEESDRPPYEIDHEFFQEAERTGFVIGYHQNAFALARFDMTKAIERYRSDVEYLRQFYKIKFVVPHGGVGAEIDGRLVQNRDVPMPPEFEGNLRWVYNRYAVRFTERWSDGGLRKTRDIQRIRSFDLVGRFLPKLEPGTRNFCLIHPQRWGYNVDPQQNPMLAEEPWYQEMLERYQ
jgi:hypothetical protein